MALIMQKGSKLKLQKADGSALNNVRIELGWDANVFATGKQMDLDVSAVLLVDEGNPTYPFGKGISEEFVLFYNSAYRTKDDKTAFLGQPNEGRPSVPGCAMVHSGDSRDGAAAAGSADEIITIYLDRMPAAANVIHIPVTIDAAVERGQTFGQVRNSWVKIYNHDNNELLAQYDLEDGDATATATAMLFVELRKKNDVWSVSAVNQGFNQGLGAFFKLYGFETE